MTRYGQLIRQRAMARRQRALAAAECALQALRGRGVKARLIGSLTKDPSVFRDDSDIDILVEDRNGLDEVAVYLEAEKQVGDIPVDLVFLETVPEDMRRFL